MDSKLSVTPETECWICRRRAKDILDILKNKMGLCIQAKFRRGDSTISRKDSDPLDYASYAMSDEEALDYTMFQVGQRYKFPVWVCYICAGMIHTINELDLRFCRGGWDSQSEEYSHPWKAHTP